jgi:glycosyltransferase involved in cell wall biosynthesis
MSDKKRVMWLLNHISARKFEIPMLKACGVDEIFLPKSFPADPTFRSASIDWSEDENLTIPKEDLDILNACDWYTGATPEAWKIANKWFDKVFFIAYHPQLIINITKYYQGIAIYRVYGLSSDINYGKLLNLITEGNIANYIRRLGNRFIFGMAYDHLANQEPEFIKKRAVYLPLGMPNTSVNEKWTGENKNILFVCPDIAINPYYNKIVSAINKNDFFVTYSNNVKYSTLVDHFNIDEDNIYTVAHAPNRLDQWLEVTGFPDTQASSDFYAQQLMLVALSKQKRSYVQGLGKDFKFIFYASQARPNKNIITLLKAYNYLLKEKFWGHKLILTCKAERLSSISDFIKENRLEYDVLFLHGLSIQELAALYKRADLAVNPTLSEGGCPFTFTEALSVGTPVIMSRIPVAEEVLTDPALQEMTFFDPLDWKCLADKILWAVDNLDELKTVQMQTYNQLIQRNWEDVVNEHIDALDAIADRTRVTYEHS